jgi:N-acetylneuraminate synthase
LGYAAPIAAAICGAQVIEKHLTFSKKMYGSDAKHSMEPAEFKCLVLSLREAWAIGKTIVNKDDVGDYREMKTIFQKSIVSSRPIKSGKIIEMDDMAYKKPGDGIPASKYKELIGKKINQNLECNVQFTLDMFT